MGSIYDGAVRVIDKAGHELRVVLGVKAQHPLISVVTPTHNRLALLRRTLESLVDQQGLATADYEVIVVIDGDYDGTAEALGQMSFPFELTVIRQVRSGVAAARNAGWRAARAGVVLFLDDDIIPKPRLLEEHLSVHRDHPKSVVIGRFSPDTSARRTAWTRYDELVQEKKYRAMGRTEAPSGIRLYTGNVSMPKAALEASGGFDQTLPRNEDVDLGLRLQDLGFGFVYAAAADGLHVGYRDFASWRRVPSLYGRLDVAMYRDRGLMGGVETIVACYHDRHVLNRAVIRLAIMRPWLERALSSTLASIGLSTYSMRLERVSYFAFSALWNILYWAGVRDGFRGNQAFLRIVRRTRRYRRRPYQPLTPTSQR